MRSKDLAGFACEVFFIALLLSDSCSATESAETFEKARAQPRLSSEVYLAIQGGLEQKRRDIGLTTVLFALTLYSDTTPTVHPPD
ncbi:MAG TPA: hypothetical protein PLR65_08335, partial [Anaerolineales bacterium]|nr:hypothetical protein [Anaerolineales bacterium]